MVRRLEKAEKLLPAGLVLRVNEGHRTIESQQSIIEQYRSELLLRQPGLEGHALDVALSEFVAPIDVAPHPSGAAVDLTLTTSEGSDLWMGTLIDETPAKCQNRCFTAADIDPVARANRKLLGSVLRSVGLVNYPTEWWHWSYGDRYWAHVTGAPCALYGPVAAPELVV